MTNMRFVSAILGCFLFLSAAFNPAVADIFPTTPHVQDNTIPTGVTCVHHQVFASSLFSTPTGGMPALITRIALAPGVNARYTANIIVRLGYTNVPVGELLPPVSNMGGGGAPNSSGPMTDFFIAPHYANTFSNASPSNFQLVFDGTPFVYDPSQGNLLVEFVIASPNHDSVNVSRAAGSSESSRAYNITGTGVQQPTIALRMDFAFSAFDPAVAGACCIPDGSCSLLTLADCQAQNGAYRGNNTECASCPQPGACCQADGTCAITQQPACVAGGGAWNGPGTSCDVQSCEQPGACFASNNTCALTLEADCTALGSVWRSGDCDSAIRPGVLISPAGICQFPVICNSSSTAVNSGLYINLSAVGSSGLSVTRIDYNANTPLGTPTMVTLWVRDGTYVGFDGSMDGWTILATFNVTSNGTLLVHPPVHLDLPTPLVLRAGQTKGLCLVANTGGLRYRTTAASVSDANLALFSNVSRTPAFAGTSVTRGFYGAVVYEPLCLADFNTDGIANSQDFFDFVAAFFSGMPEADFKS